MDDRVDEQGGDGEGFVLDRAAVPGHELALVWLGAPDLEAGVAAEVGEPSLVAGFPALLPLAWPPDSFDVGDQADWANARLIK